MKALNLLAKAEKLGLIKFVDNALREPYYATVQCNHDFMFMCGYTKTVNADIDLWRDANLSIVDMVDNSIVLA